MKLDLACVAFYFAASSAVFYLLWLGYGTDYTYVQHVPLAILLSLSVCLIIRLWLLRFLWFSSRHCRYHGYIFVRRNPTDSFTPFNPFNPTYNISELNTMARSSDFELLKLWKGRSGREEIQSTFAKAECRKVLYICLQWSGGYFVLFWQKRK